MIEKEISHEPDIRFLPRLLGQCWIVRASQVGRQGLPALGKVAVFGMKPVIVPVIERVATGDVPDFIRGRGFFLHRMNGQPSMSHGDEHGQSDRELAENGRA